MKTIQQMEEEDRGAPMLGTVILMGIAFMWGLVVVVGVAFCASLLLR